MVKHIILWQLKDEYSAAEKADIKAGIKGASKVWPVRSRVSWRSTSTSTVCTLPTPI